VTTEEMKRLRKNLLILNAQGRDVGHIFTSEDILSLSGDVLFLFDLADRLQKQNELLVEALRFYASENNWVRDQTNMIEYETGHVVFKECDVVIDYGKRAREALKLSGNAGELP
jgi:hypothetical protein